MPLGYMSPAFPRILHYHLLASLLCCLTPLPGDNTKQAAVENIPWSSGFREDSFRVTHLFPGLHRLPYLCQYHRIDCCFTLATTSHHIFVIFRHDVIHTMLKEKQFAPVEYQVILEPGTCQFRELEPRRVHARINSLGHFLVHKLTCGKRESMSFSNTR